MLFCGVFFVVVIFAVSVFFVVVWLCFCCDTCLIMVADIMLLWTGIAGQLSFAKSCC